MHYAETQYGFEYGSATVARMFGNDAEGWVTLGIETPKHSGPLGLQVYVTRTGKVRIFDKNGEWVPPITKVKNEAKR
jgi:hypothetical protein